MYKVDLQLKTWQKLTVGTLVIFIIISGSIAAFRFATRPISPVPSDIRSGLTFSPLVIPADEKSFTTSDYKFATAEGSVQILTYIIKTRSGTSVSVSEYVQPAQFVEIPEYKDRFLTNVAKQYATVQTSSGTIYLGRMAKQNNKQLAVIIDKGLLVFLTPDKELSESEWRRIGDALEVERVTE